MDPWFYLLLITLIPGIELRGSIPFGISEGLNPISVFMVAILANILVIPIALKFLDLLFHLFEEIKIVEKYVEKTHKKAHPYVEKYGVIGLAIFVAIPLPGSGAYTGSLAAHILGMDKRMAFLSISVGVLIAGLIVTLISTGVIHLWFGG